MNVINSNPRFLIRSATTADLICDSVQRDFLRVGDKVTFGTGILGSDANLDSIVAFVVQVIGPTFRVSLTSGGTAIVPASSSNVFSAIVATSVSGNDVLWVGPTDGRSPGQQIQLSYSNGIALPSDLLGTLYIKGVVDGCHIRVSVTDVGTQIVPATTSFATLVNLPGSPVVLVNTLIIGGTSPPVITVTQSVLGYLQNQFFSFQPYATNEPTTWTASALPSGVGINTVTGLIGGAANFPGVYEFELIANNAFGPSEPQKFVIGIEESVLSSESEIELSLDVESGIVTTGTDAAKISSEDGKTPLFDSKNDDDLVLLVQFKKRGLILDMDLVELRAFFKEFDPDSAIVIGDKWFKVNTGSLSYYKIYVPMKGSGLQGALSDNEDDNGTFFNALASIEWKTNNEQLGVFVADSSTDVITKTAHGLTNGTYARVSNIGGLLPAPLDAGTDYYVRDVTTDTFKLALTAGGSAINITTNGTGTQILSNQPSGWPASLRRESRNFIARLASDMAPSS